MISFSLDLKTAYPSLNQWYASSNWRKRQAMSKKIKDSMASEIIGAGYHFHMLTKFRIEVSINNRYDIDNCIPCIKLFVDTMKQLGMITSDAPGVFTGFGIDSDRSLPKGSTIITVRGDFVC